MSESTYFKSWTPTGITLESLTENPLQFTMPSNTVTLTANLGNKTTGTVPSVTIDYPAETLSTDTTMEYSTDGGTNWTTCTETMAAMKFNWSGDTKITVQFRTKATTTSYASAAVLVKIPARPAAPSVTPTAETIDGYNDGIISGLESNITYEISTDGTTWSDATVTNGSITGLADGTYYMRQKAAAGKSFTGKTASVIIAKGKERVCELTVTAPTFTAVTYTACCEKHHHFRRERQ